MVDVIIFNDPQVGVRSLIFSFTIFLILYSYTSLLKKINKLKITISKKKQKKRERNKEKRLEKMYHFKYYIPVVTKYKNN